jgi:hypothetical protein
MYRVLLIFAAMTLLGGCSTVNMVLPVNADDVATCLQQGTYYDKITRQCAPIRQPPPPTPEQQAAQAEFNKRVEARAARCTTGSRQNCLMYAQQEEIRTKAFCLGDYGSAAYNILGYKAIEWPIEMTTEQVAKSYPSISGDLLAGLVRAGYTGRWQAPVDFQREARQRCLDGNPFLG